MEINCLSILAMNLFLDMTGLTLTIHPTYGVYMTDSEYVTYWEYFPNEEQFCIVESEK